MFFASASISGDDCWLVNYYQHVPVLHSEEVSIFSLIYIGLIYVSGLALHVLLVVCKKKLISEQINIYLSPLHETVD